MGTKKAKPRTNGKLVLGLLAVVLAATLGVLYWQGAFNPKPKAPSLSQQSPFHPIVRNKLLNDGEKTARYSLFINGTHILLAKDKYFNQSKDAYIEKKDPELIHIKTDSITWRTFLKSLHMSIVGNCLSYENQQYCSRRGKKLVFYLNERRHPSAMEFPIYDGDTLMISYGDNPVN